MYCLPEIPGFTVPCLFWYAVMFPVSLAMPNGFSLRRSLPDKVWDE